MNRSLALTLLAAAAMLLPPVLAGSAEAPELTDDAGDAIPQLDVTSAWVENTPSTVTFTLKLADLSSPHPIVNGAGDYAYEYRVEFEIVGDARYTTTATILGADLPRSVQLNGIGVGTYAITQNNDSQASGGVGSTTAVVDTASDTLSITIVQRSGFALPAGSVVTGLTVTTSSSTGALAPALSGWVVADTAGPGADYLAS